MNNFKSYAVQFTLPVDNPVDNIVKIVKRGVVIFEVPINTPDLHNLGYSFLALNAKVLEKPALSTDLNKKKKKIDSSD